MKCEMCGTELGQDVVFCSTCGAKIAAQDAPGSPGQSFAPVSDQPFIPGSLNQSFVPGPDQPFAPGSPDQSFAQPQQGQYQPQQSQYQGQGQYQGQYQPPYGQNQGSPQQGYPQGQYPPQYQPQYQPYVDRGKSAKVVGILALIFGCLGGFVGIILGCVGLGMSNKVLSEEPGNKSAQAGRACSVIGLILGVVIFIAVAASNA